MLDSNGITPEVERGDRWTGLVLGLLFPLLAFGFCLIAGLVVALISWRFHPAVFLRSFWLTIGLAGLVMGVLLLISGAHFLLRFVGGPLAILVGDSLVWTGLFGSQSDVEKPPF